MNNRKILKNINRSHEIAIIYNNMSMTYDSLIQKAIQLSKKISQSIKLKKNDIVCICLGPSFEMIISMIAVLILQCTYCPIDTTHPLDYKNYILDDNAISH